MINKKFIIISLLILILMSVQCVSASDNTDVNLIGDNGDNGVLKAAPTVTQTYTDLNHVIGNATDGEEITLEYNYKFNNAYGSTDPRTGINITKNLVINGNGATIDGADASSLFNISSGVTVTLKNLTITKNGGIDGWPQQGDYSNVHCYHAITSQGTLNIVDCTFVDNHDSRSYDQNIKLNGTIYSTANINIQNSIFRNNDVQNVGVIYTTASVSVSNSYFEGNKAGSKGGAIYAGSISLIENSTFKNNGIIDSNKAIEGGAIYITDQNSMTSVKNSTFEGNGNGNSGSIGGAIYTNGAVDVIEDSIFKSNTATYGGAVCIANGASVTSVKNSTFESNGKGDVDSQGGAIYTAGAIDIIENSTFKENTAKVGGAIAIWNSDSDTSIKNSTFKGKSGFKADDGGAVFTLGTIDVIENSTFKDNYADASGGAIAIYNEYSVTSIKNSTFEASTGFAATNGGAISTMGIIDLIENSTFRNISSTEYGGAIFIHGSYSNTKIRNSTFKHLISSSSGGGAIYTEGSVEIENVDMEDNYAVNGGVIYAGRTVTISNSNSIFNNGISGSINTIRGSVIYAKGKVSVENSTFGINYAENGGAIYSESDVDFFNSNANGSGMERKNLNGGLIYAKGNVNVINSTIEAFSLKNILTHGVVYAEGNILVNNSTFSKTDIGNNGPYPDSGSIGGAIYVLGNGEIYNSNFTQNYAKQYSSVYVGGTLDIYDSYFFNNTHGCVFAEGRTVADNITFLNNTGGAALNGRVIGSNSTLNITNSNVLWTTGESGVFNGTLFSEGNLYIENCTLDHNHAYQASSIGLVICTHSNATVINCEFYENAFSGQACYGGNIYAGQNAYVLNSTFSNSTVYGGQGNTHGLVIYANDNITFLNSTVDDVFSRNSEYGALSGNYVTVSNSNFTNVMGFGAFGAAIHANVANVSDSLFYNINSTDNKDHGGAIYANNTYAYRNNFTHCHAGEGAAIFSENHTEAIENIFVNNMAQYSGQAIFTTTGFIQYNVLLNNSDVKWGAACDVAFAGSTVDSLEFNWWGLNEPFSVYGKDRAKTNVGHQGSGGDDFLPETWVIMKFFLTNPGQSIIEEVNLTTTLADYYNNTTKKDYPLGHNIAKRTVIYNATDRTTGQVEGTFSHDTATIINKDYVLYSNNDFEKHNVSSTIDYQTLYLTVTQYKLNVTKTVTNSTPNVGDIINYTITVSNMDLTDYTDPNAVYIQPPELNVTLTDLLDSRLVFISSNDTNNYNPTTGEWKIGIIPVNETRSLTIKVRVKGSGNITNYANITKINETVLKNPYGANVTIEVNESKIVILNVTKIANVTKAFVGDEIKFTINVTNDGTINATGVNITDELNNAFQFVSANMGGTNSSNVVTWIIDTIEPGETKTLELVVKLMTAGNFTNTAFANCTENQTKTNGTSDNVTVNPDVRLDVTKVVDGGVTEVYVGDEITYIITVTNKGNSTATNVNVTEILSGLVVVSGVDTNNGTWDNVAKVWNVGSIASNGVATLRLTVRVIGNGTVANAVVANSTENTTDVPANSTNVTADPFVKFTINKTVNVTDHDVVLVGDKLKYTITVKNIGLSDATVINVTDAVDSSLVEVIVAESSPNYNTVVSNGWRIDSLAPGQSETLILVVKINAAGEIHNTVAVNSSENKTPTTNKSDDVDANPNSGLSITKEANVTQVVVGDLIEYTIIVKNNGLSDATGIKVWDILPTTVKYYSGAQYDENTRNASWTIDKIEAGKSASVRLIVNVTSVGNITNTAFANCNENKTVVNRTSDNVTAIPNVELSVIKTANVTGTVLVGDKIKYEIVVKNSGLSNATDVKVIDVVDTKLVEIDYTETTQGYSPNINGWIVPSLEAGKDTTLYLVVKVIGNGTISNSVNVTSKENDTNVTNSSDDVDADPFVNLTVSKTVNVTKVLVGDKIKYTIVVANKGLSNATDVKVIDVIDTKLVEIDYTETSQGYDANINGWVVSSLVAGKDITLYLVVKVIGNGTISNSVNVTSKENDTNVTNSSVDVDADPFVNLTVNKTVNVTKVLVGDKIKYTIVVANKGLSNATDVKVIDVIDTKLVEIDYTETTPGYDSSINGWVVSSLVAGKDTTLILVVKVIGNGTISNSVNVTSKENDTNVTNSSVDVDADSFVKFTINKTVNVTAADVVLVGDKLNYTITVKNIGLSDATAINVTDVVDSNLVEVIAAESSPNYNTVVSNGWRIDSLAPNAETTLNLVVRVKAAGKIVNTVAVNSDENKTTVTNKSDDVNSGTVILNASKSANVSEVKVGDEVKFIINVTNIGTFNATDVVINDTLDSAFEFVNATEGGVFKNGVVTWNIGDLAVNTPVSVEVVVKVKNHGKFNNTAVVTSKENKTETNGTTNITVIPYVDLDVVKEANVTIVKLGEYIKFTITVTNTGLSNATNVKVSDKLNDAFEFNNTDYGIYNQQTRTVEWTINNITAGKSAEVYVIVKAKLEGTYNNTAVVYSDENKTKSNGTEVIVVGEFAVLEINKSANVSEVKVGDEIMFTITVSNIGTSDATDVVITDVLDAAFGHVRGGTYNDQTRTVTWTIDKVASRSSTQVNVTVKALSNGTFVNNVTANCHENQTDVNASSDNITVNPFVNLTVSKKANVTEAVVGDLIEYTITVENNGLSNATDVKVWDILPAGVKYVSGADNYDEATRNASWTVNNIAPNHPAVVTVVVNVTAAGNLSNTVFTNSKENKTPVNTTSDNVTVDPNVELNISKVANVTSAVVGDNIKFTINVTNNGLSNATNVVVSDVLDAAFGYVSGGVYNKTMHTVSWTIPAIEAGKSAEVYVVVKVLTNGTFANAVTAYADENKTPSNATSDDIPVIPNVELNITKVANVTSVIVGDRIKFTINVTNNGLSNATNVVVYDVLNKAFEHIDGGNYDVITGNVTWTIPIIEPGKSADVYVVVKVLTNGTFANTVSTYSQENKTPVNTTSDNVTAGPNVELNITKVANVTEAIVGDSIEYTITVKNNGLSDALWVYVWDILPEGMVYVSGADGYDESTRNVTWGISNIASGKSKSVYLVVNVTKTGNASNTVFANSEDNKTVVNKTSDNVTVTYDVELTMDKFANVTETVVGDSIEYTIVITNNGKSDATGVKVWDVLPAGIEYVSGADAYDVNTRNATWTVDKIAAGHVTTITFIVNVTDIGSLSNTAFANSTENDTVVNKTSDNVTVTYDVQLTMDKVANVTEAVVGDTIEYTIIIVNKGLSNATDVKVWDILPAGVEYVSGADNYDVNTRNASWTIDKIASGYFTSVTLRVNVTGAGNLSNTVFANSKENKTPVNKTSDNVTVEPNVELDITKVANVTSLIVGDSIKFTIKVTNNGLSNATNVVVSDVLDAAFGYVSGGVYNETTRTVTWTIDSLASNASKEVYVVVTVLSAGNFTNAVIAHCDENTTDVNGTSDNVTVDPNVKLNVTKVADVTSVIVGDNITFTIRVTNNGLSNATNVVVTDKLDAAFKYINGGDYDAATRTVTWTIGNIGAGKTEDVYVVVSVLTNGTFTNTVSAYADENKTPVNGTSDNVTADPNVKLDISKVANVTSAVVGENIKFTIKVTNNGLSNATGVVVSDVLDAAFGYVSGGAYDAATRNVTWLISNIEAGKSTEVYVVVSLLTNGTFANVVSAYAQENKTPVNGTSDNVTVNPDVQLDIAKVANVTAVYVGENIRFTITITNNGLSNATNVKVGDVLPDGVKFVSANGTYVNDGQNVLWTIEKIAGKSQVSVYVEVTAVTAGSIVNFANVTCDENSTSETNTSKIDIDPVVNLTVVKTANVSNIYVGGKVCYNIVVSNNGPSDANNVIIVDELPTGLKFVSSNVECVVVGDKVTWSVSKLAADENITIEVVCIAVGSGDLTNTVIVTCDENKTNVTGDVPIHVKDLVDVAIDLSVDNTTPDINGEIILTLKVRNNGPSTATSIVGKLNKDFLNGLEIISIDSEDIIFSSGDLLGYFLSDILRVNEDGSFTIDSLNAGEEVSATIKARVIRDGVITVDGNVSSAEDDSDLTNNYDNVTLTVHSLVDLKVNVTSNDTTPFVGDEIEYTITVVNNGPSNGTGIVVNDKLPDGVTYVSDNGGGRYDPNTGVWTIDTLKTNESKTLTIKVKVNRAGEITNIVNVTADQDNTDPDGGKTKITINAKFRDVDLSISKSVSATKAYVGDLITYTITVVNRGTTNATGVLVYEDMPDGLRYVSDDRGHDYDPILCIWYVGNLNAGESAVLNIVVQVTKAGNITNNVIVICDQGIVDINSTVANATVEVVEHAENETDVPVPAEAVLKETGNPIMMLLMVLLSAGICLIRRKD